MTLLSLFPHINHNIGNTCVLNLGTAGLTKKTWRTAGWIMSEVCVRVAVRIRPLLPREILHNHKVCLREVPGSSQVMLGSDRLFSFDHTFGPATSQDEVYESCVQPLVETLVGGYNATVFCYGQTGSGKTHTLKGGGMGKLN